MKQVLAVAAVAVATVRANAPSLVPRCLPLLSKSLQATSLQAQGHATRCLPAHLRMVALPTVDHG
jgi:hypothetical protein